MAWSPDPAGFSEGELAAGDAMSGMKGCRPVLKSVSHYTARFFPSARARTRTRAGAQIKGLHQARAGELPWARAQLGTALLGQRLAVGAHGTRHGWQWAGYVACRGSPLVAEKSSLFLSVRQPGESPDGSSGPFAPGQRMPGAVIKVKTSLNTVFR